MRQDFTIPQQQSDAAAASGRLRGARANLRRDLYYGRTTLDEVLAAPPAEAADLLVYELVRMAPKIGRATLVRLGRRAVIDKVNLFIPVGRCSSTTRQWLAENLGDARYPGGCWPEAA